MEAILKRNYKYGSGFLTQCAGYKVSDFTWGEVMDRHL